ncbi:MAG: FapA family protein [Alphaproteobacteria bacterium]|nr:FapA family protein [Alphaproteobacteria bacterium]
MSQSSLTKIFTHQGHYTHKGDVESGTTIIVKNGNCTIEGSVGDDVVLEVEGDVSLLGDAGKNLRAMANGSFWGKRIGEKGDITALGKISVEYLEYGAAVRAPQGVGVTNEDVKCREYSVAIEAGGFIHISRKWPSQETVSDSCFKPAFLPAPTAQ